jgi:hypothetical protein
MHNIQEENNLLRSVGLTKDSIGSFAMSVLHPVKEGLQDPLELYTAVKALENMCDIVKTQIKDDVLYSANKYHEKTFDFHGVKVEKCAVKTEYDYTNCDDALWNELQEQLLKLKEAISAREKFLKAVTDEVYGKDGVQIKPPVKKVTDGVKITFR